MDQEDSPDVPPRGTEVGPSEQEGTTRDAGSDFAITHGVGHYTKGLHQPRPPAEALIRLRAFPHPLHSVLPAHLSQSGQPD